MTLQTTAFQLYVEHALSLDRDMLNLKVIGIPPASEDLFRYNVRLSSRLSELNRSTLYSNDIRTQQPLSIDPSAMESSQGANDQSLYRLRELRDVLNLQLTAAAIPRMTLWG